MENEIRYYLKAINASIKEETFKPTYLVVAVKLPTGAIELIVNNQNIGDKIDYMLEAYDEEMRLKTNNEIVVSNILVV